MSPKWWDDEGAHPDVFIDTVDGDRWEVHQVVGEGAPESVVERVCGWFS